MSLEELVVEIDRIVRSPYPTQLKHLHTICTRCSQADVATWIISRPCQIQPLTRLVLDARSRWPYVLELIAVLARHPVLRDAFLQQDQMLLHDLFVQYSSKRSESLYETILILLSKPLPKHISLPECAQSFFLKAVHSAQQHPANESIVKVYTLTQGAFHILLPLLSENVLNRLQSSLCSFVNSVRQVNSSYYTLHTLAVVKVVVRATMVESTKGNLQWQPTDLIGYMEGHKAVASLQNIVLAVCIAVSSTIPEEEAASSILLAMELLNDIPKIKCQEWNEQYPMQWQKLFGRCEKTDLTSELRYLVSLFANELVRRIDVSDEVLVSLDPYLGCLRGLIFVAQRLSDDVLFASIKLLPLQAISRLLSAVPEAFRHGDLATLITLKRLLQALRNAVNANPQHSEIVLSAIVDADWSDSAIAAPSGNHAAVAAALTHARISALMHLRDLVIHLMLPQQGLSHLGMLIDDLAHDTPSPAPCSHQSVPRLHVYGDQALPTGETWHHALDNLLQSRSKNDKEAFERIFQLRCEDLETRCENVEQPLRAAEAHAAKLQQQIDQLTRQGIDQAEQNAQLSRELQHLRHDYEVAANDLREANAVNDNQANTIRAAQQQALHLAEAHGVELEQLNQKHAKAQMDTAISLAHSKAQFEDVQLLLEAAERANASLKQRLQEQDDQSAQQRHEQDQLQQSLQHLQEEHATLNQRYAQLETAHQDITTQLEETRNEITMQALAYEAQTAALQQRLAQEHEQALQNLSATHNETMNRALQDLSTTHDETMNKALQSLSTAHNETMNDINAKHDQEISALEDELTTAQHKQECTMQQVDDLEQLTEQYAAKIEELKKISHAKDVEITTLRGVRDKMMDAIGVHVPKETPSLVNMYNPTAHAPPKRSSSRPRRTVSIGGAILHSTPTESRRDTRHALQRDPLSARSVNTSPSKRQTDMNKIMEEEFDENDLGMSSTEFNDL